VGVPARSPDLSRLVVQQQIQGELGQPDIAASMCRQ
jgi:hypothetical protein